MNKRRIPDNSLFAVPHQSLEKRKEFHNAISHALRSPLVGAMGYVEYLFKGYAGDLQHEQMNQLALARESIMRLTGTIDAMLDIIAFDLRLVTPGTGKCVTQHQIELISRELCDIFRQKKARLNIITHKTPLVCEIEGHWLQSMVYEMAAALAHLSAKNTTATLSVKRHKNKCVIELKAAIAAETIAAPATLFGLFSPFRKSADRDASRRGGMGLGLARKIAQNHRGNMTADLTVGKANILSIKAALPLYPKTTRTKGKKLWNRLT